MHELEDEVINQLKGERNNKMKSMQEQNRDKLQSDMREMLIKQAKFNHADADD